MAKLDLSLTRDEMDSLLLAQRTVRLATTDREGRPHVVPLWFVWIDGTMFLNSTLGNRTVRNLESNPEAAAVVDDGETYEVLRGVILRGPVGRTGDDPLLRRAAAAWSRKYLGGNELPYARWRNRVWLRLTPEEISSWDFRKIPQARARAAASRGSP